MRWARLDSSRLITSPSSRLITLLLALTGICLAASVHAQDFQEIEIHPSGSGPVGITVGPDGNIWFTEFLAGNVARMAIGGATPVSFPAGGNPQFIAAGSDGNLWFTEQTTYRIGRMTPTGEFTDFPIPTPGGLVGIAAGPDGNLWFCEANNARIGRITTAGVVTEFPVPSGGGPLQITTGPDGNLWFTNYDAGQISRITTSGVITEFSTLVPNSAPQGITTGPDGNLWFTDTGANQIGRINMAGSVTEFPIPNANANLLGIATGPDGNLWFAEANRNVIGRITPAGTVTEYGLPASMCGSAVPMALTAGPDGELYLTEFACNAIGMVTMGAQTPLSASVDAHAVAGSSSNANGILEPGETVEVSPTWKNTLDLASPLTGIAESLTGPAGPTYAIPDTTADFGTIESGATANCHDATGDCYLISVSGARPTQHWDAVFTEDVYDRFPIRWARLIHIGNSFADVPTTHPFYAYIENLFHSGATGGCGGGNYCPGSTVTRAQMAVFLLKGKYGASHTPPPATGTVFTDVQIGDFAADWIEELASLQITGGCGGGMYCPNNPVTRAQMAVFLLKSEHGAAYVPPNCLGVFGDVACPSTFADWIEQLAAEGITAGCGGGNYCPDDPNIRGQMAVFLVKIFGLPLYGP